MDALFCVDATGTVPRPHLLADTFLQRSSLT